MEDELAMCGLLLGVMLEYKTSLLGPVRKWLISKEEVCFSAIKQEHLSFVTLLFLWSQMYNSKLHNLMHLNTFLIQQQWNNYRFKNVYDQ